MFLNKRYFATYIAFSSYIYIYIYNVFKICKGALAHSYHLKYGWYCRKCVPPWPPGDSLLSDNALTQPVFQKFLYFCVLSWICCCTNHSISFGEGTNVFFFNLAKKVFKWCKKMIKQCWLSLDEVSLKVFIFFTNHRNLKINTN